MFGSLATWVPSFFLLTLAMKFWMEPKGYRLRSAIWKAGSGGGDLAAIVFSYGSLKGIEPGVSVLVVLMSLKILEAHTAREFQVMVMIGWVLCLCGFFLSQDLLIALCLLTAFALLLVALVQFHGGSSLRRFLVAGRCDLQTPRSGRAAHRLAVSFVSPNKYRLPV